MKQVVICSGWYADSKGHSNKQISPVVHEPDYMYYKWYNHLHRQLEDVAKAYLIYQSNCEISMNFPSKISNMSVIQSVRPPTQHHHNDSGSMLMTSAMYALCNECDLMYVEQDCFVVGILGAYNWARHNNVKIAYSMFNYRQDLSRGEYCFTYVSYKYLKTFIAELMKRDWHIWSEARDFPELVFNNLFESDATRWPFGYGRNRPVNFNDISYYLQQPTDIELNKVLEAIHQRY